MNAFRVLKLSFNTIANHALWMFQLSPIINFLSKDVIICTPSPRCHHHLLPSPRFHQHLHLLQLHFILRRGFPSVIDVVGFNSVIFIAVTTAIFSDCVLLQSSGPYPWTYGDIFLTFIKPSSGLWMGRGLNCIIDTISHVVVSLTNINILSS